MALSLFELGQMCSGQIVLNQTFSRIESGMGRIQPDQRILGCRLGMCRTIFDSSQIGFLDISWVLNGFVQIKLDLDGLKSAQVMFR